MVKLKRNLEYFGRALFEAVRPDFLSKVMNYLKKTFIFIKTL